MGEYADMLIDVMIDEQGEINDDNASPTPAQDLIGDLHYEAARHSLAVRKCSQHHFQICDEHGPLVDAWPTTNRFRSHNAPAGTKARPGGAVKAVKQALYIAGVKAKRAESLPGPVVNTDPDYPWPDQPPSDTVNHPAHYTQGSMEVIEAIEGLSLGFHAGNIVKYVARYKAKGGVEDLKKARWYLDRLIELEGKS